MSNRAAERKSDRSLYNESVEDYIPLACHYDPATLLTKKGELLQVLEVTGMSAETVSQDLDSLTTLARESLSKNVKNANVACWLHTIRRQQDIDDPLPYSNEFSKSMHQSWSDKYKLKKRFVNVLYITIVMRGMDGKVRSFENLVSSASSHTVTNKHEKYLAKIAEELYETTNSILSDLQVYGASRLKIRHKGERSFSEPLYLFSHLSSFSENSVEVPTSDLSISLAVDKYALGSREIEVVHKGHRHFASILSLREYHNSGQKDLFGRALQIPVEMIATEVFYPVSRKDSEKDFKHQDYILGVTNDAQLKEAKGLDIMMDAERDIGYLKQQLSIMIISSDLDFLERDTRQVSKYLSNMGVVHVREDVNLENIFWSQLPGNFHYIRRAIGGVSENIGAFASLQSTPHGRKSSRWGKYLTVMPSIDGTTYFTNFHSEKNSGHTCLFGNKGSGKTSLMNFLISESMKYNPTIIYISPDDNPKLFVNAIGGTWYDKPQLPIIDDMQFASIIVEIMAGKYSEHLSDAGNKKLDKIIAELQKAKNYGDIAEIIENIDPTKDTQNLNQRLSELAHYFKADSIQITPGSITGISLDSVKGTEHKDAKAAIVFAALKALGMDDNSPKILVMDEMAVMLDHPYFSKNVDLCYELADIYNIAMLGAVDTERYTNVKEKALWDIVDEKTDLKVVMPHDNIAYDLEEIFDLTEEENKSLSKTQSDSVFIMKPFGRRSTIINFNSSGIEKHMRVLYGSDADLALLEDAKKSKGEKAADWLPTLFDLMEK